jgi:hypothetical protein
MFETILALVALQAVTPELSLTVACGVKANEIQVTMRNISDNDTAVLLGHVLANGKWYVPRNLTVEITRSGTGQVETLTYHPVDLPGVIAGRVDHWVMPLPSQSSLALMLRAMDFVSITRRFTPGPADQLRVRFTGQPITGTLNPDMGGVRHWRVWTGTLESNALRLGDCPAR